MSDKIKQAIERAKAKGDKRDDQMEQRAEKVDAVVREEGPKARERLAAAVRRARGEGH